MNKGKKNVISNDSFRNKGESPNNRDSSGSFKAKKNHKDNHAINATNMIGSYNPGFGSLKLQNSKNQVTLMKIIKFFVIDRVYF